jgi:hypothetical protein
MKKFTIKREYYSTHVYGNLTDEGGNHIAWTLERPENDNKPMSCIPEGIYIGIRFFSPHFKYDVFELNNVRQRTSILIHRGNTIEDSEGCILLGGSKGLITNKKNGLVENGIMNSEIAFNKFMSLLEGINEITLEII